MKSKILAVIVVFSMLGCGYYKHVDPRLYVYDNEKITQESANLEARDKGGVVHRNVCCGSMRPTIQENDFIVVVPTPFGDHLKGKVAVYRAKWNDNKPVMHRLVSGNAEDGFIASGDNNKNSEALERVREDNYLGEVISIYRTEILR